MNNFIFFSLLLSFNLCFSGISYGEILFTHENDKVEIDDNTGDLIITYTSSENNAINTVRWTPPTKFDVELKSKFKQQKEYFEYTYSIKSGKASLQNITSIDIYVPQVVDGSLSQPDKWESDVTLDADSDNNSKLVSWETDLNKGLEPGKKADGFVLKSTALPSIGSVRIQGKLSILAYPDSGPNLETDTFLLRNIFPIYMNGKRVFGIVPRITVTETTAVLDILEGMLKTVEYSLKYKLIDTVVAEKIKEYLNLSINAKKDGNDELTISYLKDLKEYIEGDDDHDEIKNTEHKSLNKDDKDGFKLIRKVLTFNIKYVKKLLKGVSEND